MYLFRDDSNYYVVDKKKLQNFYGKIEKNIYNSAFIAIDELDFLLDYDKKGLNFLGQKIPYIASIGILDFNEYTKKFDAIMVKTYIFNTYENIEQLYGGFKEMLEFLETYIYEKNINFLICNHRDDLLKLLTIAKNIGCNIDKLSTIVTSKGYADLKNDFEKQNVISILSENFNFNSYIKSIVDELYDLNDLTKKDNEILRKEFLAIKETNKTLFKKVTRLNIIEIQRMKLKLNFIYQFKNLDYDLALNSLIQKKHGSKIDPFSFKERTIKDKFKSKNWIIE
ncbi:hypothetical protein [Spiroplasma endosymbiont of Aspidapion aeneum]|uniref:hypothetical protein n=1 Tax=Spiroplasma endosymbiont of Aspidapion aeneum TaxID=3066276 RepID=UPI00313ACEC9